MSEQGTGAAAADSSRGEARGKPQRWAVLLHPGPGTTSPVTADTLAYPRSATDLYKVWE